jgi:hypothetical protein
MLVCTESIIKKATKKKGSKRNNNKKSTRRTNTIHAQRETDLGALRQSGSCVQGRGRQESRSFVGRRYGYSQSAFGDDP